jgi:tartrate-resistant acid phosphatase type 5
MIRCLLAALLMLVFSADDNTLRFAVIGDYGQAGANAEAVAEMVIGWDPDLILTTGDNNYPVGAWETIDQNIGQYYHRFIAPYTGTYGKGAETNRFFPVLGNHDWQTDDAQPYLDYFVLPGNERYYDFRAGAVHFFALDSDYNEPDGISSTSIQAEWLREGLADSTAAWQVVYLHVAPYSSGHHGSTPIMQWDYAAWGADAVIAGHDHIYERLTVNGIPYFVNGVGGGAIYALGEALPESEFRYNRNYGAMLVTATLTEMTFEFYSVGDSTTPLDTFTIKNDVSSEAE